MCEWWMSRASTCIQGKMEVELEMFHCDRVHFLLSEVFPSHRNISCDFVAKQIYGLIMDNLNYEPKMIVRHIEQTYQYTISYLKAWRAKKKVFEMRFGTYEASYDKLPRMLSQVAVRNLRSFYDTYLVPAVTRG